MSTTRDLVAAYTEGNKNFAVLFSRWMDGNEWSHPIVVNLAKGVCDGASWFHSSQISGIRQGKSQSPGPRQFIAIWKLNKALYDYKHGGPLIPGSTSSNNYKDADPVVLDDGSCPDLGWWVSCFSGIVPLPKRYKSERIVFNPKRAETFSHNYARLIRKLFVQQDLDLIENLDMTVFQHYPAKDKDRVAFLKTVLTSKSSWSPDELQTELVALTSLSNALGGPSTEEDLIEFLR